MTLFGDDEPEDAWDADDSPFEQLDNLRRRIRLVIEKLQGIAPEREMLRLQQLEEDFEFVRERIR
jgi:hypothetical protein